MTEQYVIIDDKMYLKVDGEIVDFPIPLTDQRQSEVDEVWAAFDKAGQPFAYYHACRLIGEIA